MAYLDYEGGYRPPNCNCEACVSDEEYGDSQPDGFKGILNDLANQYPGTTDYADTDIDDEIEEELDSDDDTDLDTTELSPVVSVDSDGDIVLRLQNGAHILSPEEAEEVVSKLSWALDSVFALSERVPF